MPITEKDRAMAQKCVECTVCRSARKNQRGVAFWFVKKIGSSAKRVGSLGAFSEVRQGASQHFEP